MAARNVVLASCHPKRRATRDGLCRDCAGVAATPEDPLPAVIAQTVQHAGPTLPAACYKCWTRWAWDLTGDFARCAICGATWFRTSPRVLPQPRYRRGLNAGVEFWKGTTPEQRSEILRAQWRRRKGQT